MLGQEWLGDGFLSLTPELAPRTSFDSTPTPTHRSSTGSPPTDMHLPEFETLRPMLTFSTPDKADLAPPSFQDLLREKNMRGRFFLPYLFYLSACCTPSGPYPWSLSCLVLKAVEISIKRVAFYPVSIQIEWSARSASREPRAFAGGASIRLQLCGRAVY